MNKTYYVVDFFKDDFTDSIEGMALMDRENYGRFLSVLVTVEGKIRPDRPFVYVDYAGGEWKFYGEELNESFRVRECSVEDAAILAEYVFSTEGEFEVGVRTRGEFPFWAMEDFIEG